MLPNTVLLDIITYPLSSSRVSCDDTYHAVLANNGITPTRDREENADVAVRFKVKEVAKAHGYSQYRLQKETGIDIRILRRVFRNQPDAVVTTETLDRIATVLGVDIAELIESTPSGNQTS